MLFFTKWNAANRDVTSFPAPYSNNAVNGSTTYALYYNKEVPFFNLLSFSLPVRKQSRFISNTTPRVSQGSQHWAETSW